MEKNRNAEMIIAALFEQGWTKTQPTVIESGGETQIEFEFAFNVIERQDFENLQQQFNPDSIFIEVGDNGQLVCTLSRPILWNK